MKFYNNLIDALIVNGIEPMITLFHWDYPYELHCKGVWHNRESSDLMDGFMDEMHIDYITRYLRGLKRRANIESNV